MFSMKVVNEAFGSIYLTILFVCSIFITASILNKGFRH